MEEEYKLPKIKHESGNSMELDAYIREIKLGVEYQGQQHFKPVYGMTTDFATQKRRDEEKQKTCKEVVISVVK